ncbi:MAG TPA: uracil-DNA glycosylase [Fimbriimonadales bacterium]|nr:uracil-DNA glycosylase [Fimbriimonadales bacterium]
MTKQQALAQIAKRIARCKECKYHPKQKPVPGEGNPDAKVMFIGEAPGSKENETGRPFVGRAGKFLEEFLHSIGLKREDVFITNVVKYQPPNNRPPTKREIQRQLPFLKEEIAIVSPLLICLLGSTALNALLPEIRKPISKLHGRLIEKDNRFFLPLYHPISPVPKRTFLKDFAKIPEYLKKIEAKQ